MKKCLVLLCSLLFCFALQAQPKKEILYVGTFSVRGSQGIYAFSFDRVKRTLKLLQAVPSLKSPTFLALHPSGKFLYTVNRGKADVADNGGSVSAYGIDPKTGKLSGLNNRPSYGADPCYISVDKTGRYVFVANYNEGNLVVLPLFDDGLIGNPSDAKKYVGGSVDPERQEGPHIHSAVLSPDNRFLYVSNLGADKVYIYEFNAAVGTLTSAEVPEIDVAPGSGPRHFTFHPNGRFAYLSEELSSTVCAFSVDNKTGALTILQDTVSSLPATYKDANTSADIHTDIKGKYLYLSNRGMNSISIYTIAPTGKITLVGQHTTGGQTPRNMLVDPKGEFLFVANQDSDTIILFKINPKNGMLIPVGKPAKVPSPVCMKLLTL